MLFQPSAELLSIFALWAKIDNKRTENTLLPQAIHHVEVGTA
jgi:hypothetical protein